MAGKGAIPKLEHARERVTKARLAEFSTVTPDDHLRGPDLPPGEWPEQTVDWWDELRRSPLAQKWTELDWSHLRDTALIHRKLWQGDLSQAAELRLRMAKVGATVEDRLRLRIQVDDDVKQVAQRQGFDPDRRARLITLINEQEITK